MKLWQRWKQTTVANKLLVWTGAIVAVGTFGQVGISILSYLLMVRSATETGNQIDKVIAAADNISQNINKGLTTTLGEMKDQTKAMQDMANARGKNAKTAEQTLRMTQRAYVDLTDWALTKHPTEGLVDVTFKFTNTGHSPAILIRADYGSRVGRPLPTAPKYGFTRVFNNHQLHPGRSLSSTMTSNNIMHDRLLSLKPDYWFFVQVVYRDEFGQHRSCAIVTYEYDRARLAIYPEAPPYNCGD